MDRRDEEHPRRKWLTKAILFAGWLVALSGYASYRATAAPAIGDSAGWRPEAMELKVIRPGSSDSIDLLEEEDVALALISLNCDVCVSRKDEVARALRSIPAERRFVLPTLREPAEVLVRMGYPEELVAEPALTEWIDSLRTGFVPSFLLLSESGAEVVWLGLPNWLQRWMRRVGFK